MKTYQITISSVDLPYVLEAIGLRALSLQQSIQSQVQAAEKIETSQPIVVPKDPETKQWLKEIEKVAGGSRKEKRDRLMKLIKAHPELTTAEIARRAGVSYLTAHKARKA